jgi:hypothetical protein
MNIADSDLPSSLTSFADQLQDLIDELLESGQNERAMACAQAQSSLRTSAGIILAVNLLKEFQSRDALDAIKNLKDATNTLNANANRIARQQQNVSAAVGIAAGAAEVAGAVTPFALKPIQQGLIDILGAAQLQSRE